MDTLYQPAKAEAAVAKLWEQRKVREQALQKAGKPFYFLDGPPYATAAIHLGTAWNKILKDTYLRWLRMAGFKPWAQPGFDTHGTPIEVQVEKALGFRSKKDIERYGIGRFIATCREFATKNIATMSAQFLDLGVWMDWEKPYLTLDNAYIEGAWHTFKAAAEQQLLYKGAMPAHVCTRCETVVAYNEIEHKQVVDPAVYVKFRVKRAGPGKAPEFFVIWTTTPWSLPGNTGVMVHPEVSYAKVQVGGEVLYVAKELVAGFLEKTELKGKVIGTVKGKALEGLAYEHPLAEQIPLQQSVKNGHRVVLSARYVTLDTGTGLVHCSPGHGTEDFLVGKETGLPVLSPVGMDGRFRAEAGGWLEGKHAKQADALIIAKLSEVGALVKKESYAHEYPTCWRCATPLLLLNVPQWFFKVTAIREKLLAENQKVRWVPEWAGERFTDWLENLGDWPVGRQRYWGIPLPIWECVCGEMAVVGSYAELAKKGGKKLVDFHRPAIDEVSWKCEKCGERMRRVPEVLDVWFDSGVAPWASLGYPADKKEFERLWPAKFELEGPDQFRGWWNSQLITGVLTFGRAPFESVLLHGFILDAKGLKMSKSLGNVVGPEDVVAKHGRDVLRFYLLSGTTWDDFSFNWEGVNEVQRALNIFWNAANFVHSYAPNKVEKEGLSVEDQWILSRLEALRALGIAAYEGRRVHEFVNAWRDFLVKDFSRWYIKLVRDRVSPWASGPGKRAAQWTLRTVLEQSCLLLAPVAPFISEQVWQEVFADGSVHLREWPAAGKRDEQLEAQMAIADAAVEAVNALRTEQKVKLRWPLASIRVAPKDAEARAAVVALSGILRFLGNAEKIEVVEKAKGKEFEFGTVELGKVLMEEAFVRELVRFVQDARKKAGLQVTDKIHLVLRADGESEKVLKAREAALAKDVGAKDIVFSATLTPVGTLEFEGQSVQVALRKA